MVLGADNCIVPEVWFKNITVNMDNTQIEKLIAAGNIDSQYFLNLYYFTNL